MQYPSLVKFLFISSKLNLGSEKLRSLFFNLFLIKNEIILFESPPVTQKSLIKILPELFESFFSKFENNYLKYNFYKIKWNNR